MGVLQVSENQEDSALILESPEVQSFITAFLLEVPDGSLKPKVSFENGVSYPGASNLLRKRNSEQVNAFLRKLSNVGLLDRALVDKLIACPSCKGTKIYSKYQCSRCKSVNMSAVEILEHRLCGYIGSKTNFLVDPQRSSALTCPKCKQALANDSDYRKLGKTFECASCKTRFDTPPIVHNCKKCNKLFTYNESEYEPVYEYSASPKMKEIFSTGAFSLNTVVQWLKDRGFRVESPKEVSGASKERHKFDVVASAGVMENLLLGDFSPSLDNKAVIAAFAKRYDVNQSAKSFIVTYEKIPESIETLAKTYGISIIVIDPQNPGSLNDQLSRMVGGTPQIIPSSSPIISPLPVESKKADRRLSHPSRPVAKSSEKDQLKIISEVPKSQGLSGRRRKGEGRKLQRAQEKSGKQRQEENELANYYLENDFGRENSDDVYLSPVDESE
jgi:uncharacterized protein YbaR (Trm112 family)